MLLPLAAAIAAPTSPYTQLSRAQPPGLCLSAIPDAGRLPAPARAPFAAAATTLTSLSRTPNELTQWWTTFEPTLAPLPAHPALDALRATVEALRSNTYDPAPFLALADAYPKDPCVAASAASAAFTAGDFDRARSMAGRAWIPMPSADLAYILAEVALRNKDDSRVPNLLSAGFEFDPDHAGLRRLRAELALKSGGAASDDLAFLQQKGDRSLDPMLMQAHYEENRMEDYLRLAQHVSPPLGLLGNPDDPTPMTTFRTLLGLQPGETLQVVLDTSEGSIPCTLFLEQAPYTVAMFLGFATGKQPWTRPDGSPGEGPLYKDLVFHRVIPGFMIQGGDPAGNGTGGPGFQFHDEIRPDLRFDRPLRLAMANAGPGTNGSQFFVTEAPTPHLDGKHTIFGQCSAEGVVASIAGVPRDSRDLPRTPVLLREVRVDRLAP